MYTDPAGARALFVQLEAQLTASADEALTTRLLVMRGNLANLDYRFEDAAAHFTEARRRARAAGDAHAEAEVLADYAGTLLNLDRVSEAAQVIDEGQALASRAQWPSAWRLALREGFLRLQVGSVEEALAGFAKAKGAAPELAPADASTKDAYYGALLYAGFGRVYTVGQDLGRASEAYQRVVELCAQFNMRGRLPFHYLDLGRAHMANGRRAEATENLERAIASAGPRDKHALAAANANLGYYALHDEDWATATQRLDAAEHHYRTASPPATSDLSVVHLWRASMHRARGKTGAAEESLIASLETARAGEDRAQEAAVCREIAEYYAELDRYRDAYEYRLLYEQIQREVEEQVRAQRIGELELRHEVEERRRESELLKLKAARLQLKALRAQMNPHFMFNALNSIQEFITSERADEAAEHLAHFARLMRQSLNYSERETITLEEEVDFLGNYLALNRELRFAEAFTYDISVGDELEDDIVGLPAMLVQPYVENAIEHGVRLVERGHISVAFDSPPDDDSVLEITITDNGIGRARAAEQQARRSTAHRSMGTAITQRRLELLNAGGTAAAAVRYEDLLDTDGTAAGTRVHIRLPILWQHA